MKFKLYLYHKLCGFEWEIPNSYKTVCEWWASEGRLHWCGRCRNLKATPLACQSYWPLDVELRLERSPHRLIDIMNKTKTREIIKLPLYDKDSLDIMKRNGWDKFLCQK